MRHFIEIVENALSPIDLINRAGEACRDLGVNIEMSHTDPDDSVWASVSELPVDPNSVIIINDFSADHPRQGRGSKAMAVVVGMADRFQVELALEPFSGRTPTPVLVRFYSRFGFEVGTNGWMFRKPQPSK